MLADEFENFPNICLKMLSSDPGLTWEAGFKKAEVKLDLLTDIIKGIRLKIYNFFYRYFPYLITNTRNVTIEIENVYFLNIGMKISYTVWQYPKKSPINNFAWIEDTCQCNEDSIKKIIMKKVMKDIILNLI